MRRDRENPAIYSDRVLIKRLFVYFKPQAKSFIIAFFMMLFAVSLDLLLPLLSARALAHLGEETVEYHLVLIFIGIYALCLFFSYLIQYFQTMTLQRAGQQIIYQMREDLFTHIEKLSHAQLNAVPIGKMVTRVTSDTNTLNEFFTSLLINLIRNVLTMIGVIIAMFLVNVKLTLIVLAVTPLVFILSIIFRKFSRKAYRDVRFHVSNINAFLAENLSGMKITQIFNQEEKKSREFRQRNKALRHASFRQTFIFGIFRPSIYGLSLITLMLVLWFGALDALTVGIITFEIIYIFYRYINQLFRPIEQLAQEFDVLQSAFASSERIFSVLDTKPEIVDYPGAIELEEIKGEIEFKNVWFKYVPNEWVLKDVSFKIEAGSSVAFVGATGSGKTTILSLIVRNYDIDRGQILIDGIDIKKIKIASLRKNIGQMLQDVFLFSGTIFSNIQMRDENITLEDVKAACKYVNADKFIDKLDYGYLEPVRERGNNFSAGQRQLLSFARTIVHRPKVMILDEATANIDTETEVLIQQSLEKMMNIGTMIMVAHRLSTIQHADKIIVLQKGKIIEEGNHQELLKKKGHYYKLYQLQYQNPEEK